ncbi:Cytosolic seryl-tRNA synthetase [Sorochytrium milnesiophthora]
MIDINLLRADKGGNPDLVRASCKKRGQDPKVVDDIIALDNEWKSARFDLDEIKKKINAVQKQIGQKMKAKEDASELLAQKKQHEEESERLTEREKAADEALRSTLITVGNLVHESVIDSKNEDNNEVVRTWNKDGKQPEKNTSILSHHEVLTRIDGYDPERGVRVAGHRGYFLTGDGVDLILGLVQYGLAFLKSRGYKKLMTPYFMNKEVMARTAQLSQFDEELYKVTGETDDKYLIATSEQPISAFHAGEWVNEESLPLRYAGFSSCFRKEAGAHGKDTWGIFRVHQFEKVEQFVLTDPEKSWEMLEEMLKTSEDFYQSLGLSYRVVSIVSGALNNAAAKKYDLEAWFPFQGEYKELVSCSNCTDYQSRRLEIREREKKYVHCLNATLTAAERTLCCILENWQTETGVVVPEPMRPFMGGQDFIPYTVELKGKVKSHEKDKNLKK